MIWSLECERKKRRVREEERVGSGRLKYDISVVLTCLRFFFPYPRTNEPRSSYKWSLRSYSVYVCVGAKTTSDTWTQNRLRFTVGIDICTYADIQHVSNRIVSEINRFGYASDRSIETINFDVPPTSTHCNRHTRLLHCGSTMGPRERNTTCETQLIRIGKPFTVRYNWNLK